MNLHVIQTIVSLSLFVSTYLEDIPVSLDVSGPAVGTGAGELHLSLQLTKEVYNNLKLLLAANSVLVVLSARLRHLHGGREILSKVHMLDQPGFLVILV